MRCFSEHLLILNKKIFLFPPFLMKNYFFCRSSGANFDLEVIIFSFNLELLSHQQDFHWKFDDNITNWYNFEKSFAFILISEMIKIDSVFAQILQNKFWWPLWILICILQYAFPFISSTKTFGSLILIYIREYLFFGLFLLWIDSLNR